jgi:hypothetical protein
MDIRITLDPALGLSAFDFIITWNALPECRQIAMARTSAATPVFFDPNLAMGAKLVLSGVDENAAAEDFCALVRRTLERRDIRQEFQIGESTLPDGGWGILVKP